MAGGIRLKQLKVSGFRGFTNVEETIDLSGPMVIFSGGNRSGKSSTLNAIEWALYGDEVVGSGKVNIEERKGWLVKNIASDRATVELRLDTPDGDIIVRRATGGGKGQKSKLFYYVDENGEKHEDPEELWHLLGLGPKDFMSSAYLHQEVIRDLLVTTPSVRKAALDRLLGVSDLRNLFEAFKAIKVKSYETGVDEVYADLENDISLKASSYKEQLRDLKEEGERLGLEKTNYTEEEFLTRCAEAVEKLSSLAKKAKVGPVELNAPANPEGFQDFADEANEEIDRLRVENPGAESQRRLDAERQALDGAASRLAAAADAMKELKDEKKQLEKENGSAKDLEKAVAECEEAVDKASAELAQVSERMNVVNETIDYLQNLEDRSSRTGCPACGQDIVPEELLKSLESFKEKSAEQTEELESRKSAARKELKRLRSLIDRLSEIAEEEMPAAKSYLAKRIEELEKALGRKLEKDEDPDVAVERKLSEIDKAVEKNRKLLVDYTAGLTEVSRVMDAAKSIAGALTVEKKIKKLNSVKKSDEWVALDAARDRLFEELGYVDKVRDVVEEVLGEVSRSKVEEARDHVAGIYGHLVERPDFNEIEIDPDSNYEVYASGGGRREKLVSFFNQGDMNCAALAVFLALGTGRAEREGGASFLLMDDPSQSLDRAQKERLVRVIDEVTEGTQLLLSTMDSELLESARKDISRKKRVFNLGNWDPKSGPSISEE